MDALLRHYGTRLRRKADGVMTSSLTTTSTTTTTTTTTTTAAALGARVPASAWQQKGGQRKWKKGRTGKEQKHTSRERQEASSAKQEKVTDSYSHSLASVRVFDAVSAAIEAQVRAHLQSRNAAATSKKSVLTAAPAASATSEEESLIDSALRNPSAWAGAIHSALERHVLQAQAAMAEDGESGSSDQSRQQHPLRINEDGFDSDGESSANGSKSLLERLLSAPDFWSTLAALVELFARVLPLVPRVPVRQSMVAFATTLSHLGDLITAFDQIVELHRAREETRIAELSRRQRRRQLQQHGGSASTLVSEADALASVVPQTFGISLISAIVVLVASQKDRASWTSPEVQRAVGFVMSTACAPRAGRSRVRAAAVDGTAELLQAAPASVRREMSEHIAKSLVQGFSSLPTHSSGDDRESAGLNRIILLLQGVLHLLSPRAFEQVVQTLVTAVQSRTQPLPGASRSSLDVRQPVIVANCFSVLEQLFRCDSADILAAQPGPKGAIPVTNAIFWKNLVADVVLRAQPRAPVVLASTAADHAHGQRALQLSAVRSFISTSGAGFCRLAAEDKDTNIAEYFECVSPFFCVRDSEVTRALRRSLSEVLRECVHKEHLLAIATELSDSAVAPVLTQLVDALQALLTFPYSDNWSAVLSVVSTFFETVGTAGTNLEDARLSASVCAPLLLILDQLKSAPSSESKRCSTEIDACFASAIRAFGARALLTVLPVDPQSNDNDRLWLIPFIAQNLDNACGNVEMQFVVEYFLPLADDSFVPLARNAAERGLARAAMDLFHLASQCWDVFVAVAKVRPTPPIDLSQTFCVVARRLGSAMQSSVSGTSVAEIEFARHVRGCALSIVSSVYKSVLHSHAPDSRIVRDLGEYAAKFLPVLFTLFTSLEIGPDLDRDALLQLNQKILEAVEQCVFALSVNGSGMLVSFFKNIVGRLLKADTMTEADGGTQVRALADLVCTFIPCLDSVSAEFVFQIAAPYATEAHLRADPKHKKMIKILCSLITELPEEAQVSLVASHKHDLFESILCADLVDHHPNLKKLFLRASRSLVAADLLNDPAVRGDENGSRQAQLAVLLASIIQCVKEGNKGTQAAAYGLLLDVVAHSQSLEPEREDGYSCLSVLTLLVAGLAGSTPLMVSGSMLCLARVCFEASVARKARRRHRTGDLPTAGEVAASVLFPKDSQASSNRELVVLDQIIAPIIDMLGTEQREICTSALRFLKLVLMGVWPRKPELAEQLFSPHVEAFMQRICAWSEDVQGVHRSLVKSVLRRLVRRYGSERLVACLDGNAGSPDEVAIAHVSQFGGVGRILMHINKVERRRLRRQLQSEAGSGASEKSQRTQPAVDSTISQKHSAGVTFEQALIDSDSEDDGDDTEPVIADDSSDSDDSSADLDDDPDDLLTRHLSGTAGAVSTRAHKRISHSFQTTDDRKLIINDVDEGGERATRARWSHLAAATAASSITEQSDLAMADDSVISGSNRASSQIRKRSWGQDADDSDDDEASVDSGSARGPGAASAASANASRKNWEPRNQRQAKRQRGPTQKAKAPGEEFRSKKAGGDMRRKGAVLEPYAYVPLDPSTMNRRGGQKKALQQYESIVRGAKKGAQKGQHNSRNRGRR